MLRIACNRITFRDGSHRVVWLAVWLVFLPGFVAAADQDVFQLLNDPDITDPAEVDDDKLPVLSVGHSVIRRALPDKNGNPSGGIPYGGLKFQLHSYLLHHDGRYWCIWSEGPPVEDEPTQEVRYATSADGTHWSESKSVTGEPQAPYAFIARGLWVRDGELLALAAHFKGKGAFGTDKELELRAYIWDPFESQWRLKGPIYDNAINNFPPMRLATGDWILTRRDSRFNVSMLIGGRSTISDWKVFPVVERGEVKGFSPDEPIIWQQPDDSLVALFRDNGGSQRLFYAVSTNHGQTWSKPQITNYPNATSKLFSLQTSRGERLLISNANPKLGRRSLHVSFSRDGREFTRLSRLDIPAPPMIPPEVGNRFNQGLATLQYPHAIEHDGQLWVTFSRNKKQIELIRLPINGH